MEILKKIWDWFFGPRDKKCAFCVCKAEGYYLEMTHAEGESRLEICGECFKLFETIKQKLGEMGVD